MSYYLSKENERFLIPFVKILERSSGEVILDCTSAKALIDLLRNGANTRFPVLKNWRYKNKITHVLAIPKNPAKIIPMIKDEYLDYIGIVGILMSEKPELVIFTNAFLTEAELNKLQITCERLNYVMEKSASQIRVTRCLAQNAKSESISK